MRTKTRSTRTDLIRGRLGEIANAGASVLGSFAGLGVRVEIGEFLVRTGGQLVERVVQPLLLVRQRIVGHRGEIGYLLGRREAVTLACLGRPGMDDQELRRRRSAAVLDPRDLDGLQDVAWLLAERGDRVMRRLTGQRLGLAFEGIDPLTPESFERLLPSTRDHGVVRMRVSLESIPPADLVVVADPHASDLLDAEDPSNHAQSSPIDDSDQAADGPETGPVVHAFLHDGDSAEIARRCCQKLALTLRRHPGHTAPNPAVIRDGVLLIDVPVGFDQRFDWCRRIKESRPEVSVVMLVHHPSRGRVLRAFEARADTVIGWPTDPLELAIRLRRLVTR